MSAKHCADDYDAHKFLDSFPDFTFDISWLYNSSRQKANFSLPKACSALETVVSCSEERASGIHR